MAERDLRICAAPELRVSKSDDGSSGKLEGYAAVFDVLSEDLGGFRERIAPGAFSTALASDSLDVRAYVNHQGGMLTLGRTRSGTLRLAEDRTGLRYSVDLPDTTAGRDLATLVDRGDIDQSSFAFSVAAGGESWDEGDGGVAVRTVVKVRELYDVSPVNEPAYPQTSGLTLRSLEAFVAAHAAPMRRLRMGQRHAEQR